MKWMSLVVLGALMVALTVPAFARCRIKNETKYSFKVESGNVSNQSVGAHTTTSIASGKIRAVSSDGKSVGGSCSDGDTIKIVEDRGVLVIEQD